MAEPSHTRFAVGRFKAPETVREALADLRLRGITLNAVNYLGSRAAFEMLDASEPQAAEIRPIEFPGGPPGLFCTAGNLADRLDGRSKSGAETLQDALERWLIPLHAVQLQQDVEDGLLLLWVQLSSDIDERIACRSLLRYSLNSVRTHDLALPA